MESRDLPVIIVDLSDKHMHRFKVPKTHRYCINDIFFRILVSKSVTFEVVLFRGVVLRQFPVVLLNGWDLSTKFLLTLDVQNLKRTFLYKKQILNHLACMVGNFVGKTINKKS